MFAGYITILRLLKTSHLTQNGRHMVIFLAGKNKRNPFHLYWRLVQQVTQHAITTRHHKRHHTRHHIAHQNNVIAT